MQWQDYVDQREKAVLYCRVSTTDELQRSSLEAQQEEGKRIAAERGWNLIKIFAEQETGTNIESRFQYQEMMRMIQNDEVDILIVKSIDRLNRNEADWYNFLEIIERHDVRMFQTLENRFFDCNQDTLLSGIKAILAAEYSRELSKKIKKAHRYRQEKTHHVVLSSRTYALKSHSGIVTVDEHEAEMVRRIFELSASGYGSTKISNILFSEGYLNRNGNRLNETTIIRIITNPLFKGDAVFNKRRYDFEKKKTIYTNSEEWIVAKNVVPQIVSDELWEKANKSIRLRVRETNKPYKLLHDDSGCRFTGKLFCGICKAPYYRCFVRGKGKLNSQTARYVYRCKTYKYQGCKGGCNNIFIPEEDLNAIVDEVAKQFVPIVENEYLKKAYSILASIIQESDNVKQLANIESELEQKAEEKYHVFRSNIKKQIDPDLVVKVLDDIDKEIAILEKKKTDIQTLITNEKTVDNRMQELMAGKNQIIKCIQKKQTMELIKQIVVFPEVIYVYIEKDNDQKVNSDVSSKQIIPFKTIAYVHTIRMKRKIYYKQIVDLINDNPKQTVKQMAEELNVPVRTIQNRVASLRREGYIRYNTNKEYRCWEVIKSFEEI